MPPAAPDYCAIDFGPSIKSMPLSIAVATGARVAQLRGAASHEEARRSGWQGIGLSVFLSVVLGGLLYAVRDAVVAGRRIDRVAAALPPGVATISARCRLGCRGLR